MTLYADVILPLPLDQAYTYLLPKEMEEKTLVGSRVLVPLGERWLTGIVVGLRKRKPGRSMKIKPVAELLDETPLFSTQLLSLTRRLSRTFLVPWGEMLQSAVPPSLFIRSRAFVSLTGQGKEALDKGLLSEDERKLAVLLGTRARSPLFLERKSGLKNISTLLSRMKKKDLVTVEKTVRQVRRRVQPRATVRPAQLELDFSSDDTVRRAAGTISGEMEKGGFFPFLLFGPDGRRKAVYSHLLRTAISTGGQALFLVPEISLTPALIEEFEKSLGNNLALLHSRMTDKQREIEWQRIRERRVQLVIGPRSALFSPLVNLRLIILDDEQDDSYSQQEGLSFDVRRAARLRAEEEKAVLVLGSSAPTIESFHWARKGHFLIDLGRAPFKPRVSLFDFRGRSGLIDTRLIQAIRERLDRDEQAILFFNRRGYASFLVCNRCGFVPDCDRCALPLAYHRGEGKLVCHACRRSVPAEMNCPRCGGRLAARRNAGIEAVAEELRRTFPRKRTEVFAADEASRKGERESLLGGFKKKEIDILVGTQFLAHQAGLPPVSLVIILHPEMALHLVDFRSGQKAYHTVSRVGRFLREEKNADVLIQTASPDHYSIREAAKGDYEAFYEQEIKFRRLLDYPPFSSLAEVIFSGVDLRRLAGAARVFASRVKTMGKHIQVYGPALAPIAKLRGLHRIQVTLRARKTETIARILAQVLPGIRIKKSVFFFD